MMRMRVFQFVQEYSPYTEEKQRDGRDDQLEDGEFVSSAFLRRKRTIAATRVTPSTALGLFPASFIIRSLYSPLFHFNATFLIFRVDF